MRLIFKLYLFSFLFQVLVPFLLRAEEDKDVLENARISSGTEVSVLKKQSVAELYERYSSCVVKVKCSVDGKPKIASGFFVSQMGHILTPIIGGNDFCIENACGQVLKANKLGEDKVSSLCLLKVELQKQEVPYFSLVRSIDDLTIGQSVISLSCKLGLNISPQKGYITGFNDRYFDTEWPMTFIRTSLHVDGCDGGGAVLDRQGVFLGMLLHALQETHETFFIPVTGLYKIFQDLLLHGRVRYGFVGLNTQVVFDKKYQRTCLQVIKVHLLSPAERAGLKEGDILIKVNDNFIDTIGNFKNSMFSSNPGDKLSIEYSRNDVVSTTQLELSEKL